MRVVSLVPSLTETLLAWGVEPIACTRFCEQPTMVHVGGTKDPDVAAIVGLEPDAVLMDREENRREDAEALVAAGIDVIATHVTSVDDVAAMTAMVRQRLGMDAVPPSPAPPLRPPWTTAFVPIWRRPWMTCSARTYGSSLLAAIGVVNVFADSADTYPQIELTDVVRREPALVLLPSEPYPFAERHEAEVAAALAGARIVLIDGQDLFWWGARTDAARLRLAEVIGAPPPDPAVAQPSGSP